VWAHGIEQPAYFAKLKKNIPNIEFVDGFPEKSILDYTLFKNSKQGCLIIGMYVYSSLVK